MVEFRVEELRADEGSRWIDFINSVPNKTPFHTLEWASAMSSAYKYAPFLLLTQCFLVTRGKNAKGGIMLFTRFFKKIALRPFTYTFSDAGPLVLDDCECLSELFKVIERTLKVASIRIETQYSIDPSVRTVLTGLNYASHPSYTFIVDLEKPCEVLYKGLEKRARWSIRKAEREGVLVDELAEREELHAYYDLHMESYRRARLFPYSFEFFEALWENFVRRGRGKIFLAKYQEKPIAGAVVLLQDDWMWYLNAASSARYRELNAPSLLLWSIIEWGNENEYHVLDLCGTRPKVPRSDPHYGTYLFKRGFGGRLVDQGSYEKILRPVSKQVLDKVMIPLYTLYRVYVPGF